MSYFSKKFFIDRYGNNKLAEIFSSNIFWIGLIIKIILASTLASNFLTKLFIPFVNYYFTSGISNPYEHFIAINHNNAFPYPALMLYIMSIPRIVFNSIINWDVISSLTVFLTRIPILFADITILIILSRLAKEHTKKIILYYWLSPILIYISYIHGQLDAIPVSMLFIYLYFLFKNKFEYASIFLGLAVAAKTNMIAVIPFYFSYLLYSKTVNFKKLLLNFIIIATVFIIVNLPYLFSSGFIEMVFHNKEQIKIFDFKYHFSDGNTLYFAPLAYVLLFINAIELKGFSKDVYMMFLGFSFGIMTMMVSPMQGWYYWIIPFFIYFHTKRSNEKFDFTLILFLGLQVAYFIYFLIIKESDYLQSLQIILPNIATSPNLYASLESVGINMQQASNLSFTLLQAMLLANCIFIYKSGVKSYANYKIFSHPFLLGICGDSGAGKTTISNAIESIFKNRNTTIIHGDDMHKWERGDANWDNITHLNPKSNFLHQEISYLKAIKNGETISRRNYDHKTGRFSKERRFRPGNLVIFEGLHSFYIKQVRDLYDLKVFINPSEKIRTQWKINRDTKNRGYDKDKVLEQMHSRTDDAEKFIKSQIKYADIIVETLENKPNNSLKITATNSFYLEPLVKELCRIESINTKHEYEENDKQFIDISGGISEQMIDNIAYNLSISLKLEDLGINSPSWDKDHIGIIQLFIAYCIMKNLHNYK